MSRGGRAREIRGRAPRPGRALFGLARAVLLVVLVASCRSAPAPTATQVDPERTLDVVTLNLWHDRSDWQRRQALIAEELRRLRPDVVLLQEVLQDAGLPNQAGTLAAQLGYQWHFVSADPPERVRRYGNAILTRQVPLARGGRLLQPLDDYRAAAWVRIDLKGQPVNAYVVHLNFTDASGATRATQVRDLLSLVDATRGDAPVLIGGDFNTTADSEELAGLRARHFDTYAVANGVADSDGSVDVTLNPHFHPQAQRIDHVFAQTGAFRVVQARRILDQPAPGALWASDHYGVWVRLSFEARGKVGLGPPPSKANR